MSVSYRLSNEAVGDVEAANVALLSIRAVAVSLYNSAIRCPAHAGEIEEIHAFGQSTRKTDGYRSAALPVKKIRSSHLRRTTLCIPGRNNYVRNASAHKPVHDPASGLIEYQIFHQPGEILFLG